MLHAGKRESIIAWFNAMTMMKKDFSIQSITEFSDGKKFIVLISIVNNLKKGILPEDFENTSTPSESKDPDSKSPKEKRLKSGKDEKTENVVFVAETDDELTTEMEIEISTEMSDETTTETHDELGTDTLVIVEDTPNEMNETEIMKRYEDIRKFIDDFLAHDSSSIVVYSECLKGKEIELAKVAVLLLSAMVQSYLSINMEHLYFTTVLNLQAQEDIKECLSLILMETDEPLKKVELHKILGRPSKSKSTPRRRTPSRSTDVLETPENSRSLSKKKQVKAVMTEEIFESPLKNLWDSPKIQLKTCLFKKDVEINKLRDALHIEECKVIDLTIEKRSLNAELEKKKRELEFLKEDQRRALENADEVNAEKTIKLEEHLAEKQKDNKKIHELKEEIDVLKKENEKLSLELAELEKLSKKEFAEEINFKQKNIELVEKIKDLELNISLKDGKIKDLKERELSLKSDLKHYRLMLEESNKITASPNAGRKSFENSNIIYADSREVMKERDQLARDLSIEQENVKSWKKSLENAERALLKYENDLLKYKNELEKKDQELKYKNETLLVYKSWQESVLKDNKNQANEDMAENLPLALLPCDNFDSKSSTIESDNDSNVKEEPETSVTSTIWDTHKAVGTRRSGSRRVSASTNSFSCTNSELNVFKDKMATVTLKMTEMFDKSDVQLLNKLESQAKSCSSLKDVAQYFAIMGSLIDSMKSAQPTKRNSARGTASGMQNELANIKHKMDELQKEYKLNLDMKTNELRLAEEKYKALELKIQDLNQTLEKSQQDVKDATNKLKISNQNYQKVLSEQKQLLKVYMALDEEKKSAEPCKECQIWRKRLSNMKQERNDYEKEASELKALVKELESRAKNLERQLKVEIKEKKKLEFQIQRESAFLSGSLSDKRAVINKYFQQGLAESKRAREKKLEASQQQQQPPVVSLNAFILTNERENKEPCLENSMSSTFANRSIRSGFLQTDDEEDFLNHSSLAQIQRDTRPENEELTDRRLTEIRRRNTLCLPHLQSSYPLELQNMTPTERKYFEFRRPKPVADDLISELVNDSDESNDEPVYPVNKRKVSEMEGTFSQPAKKQARVFPIKRVSKEKPTTPIRNMFYKGKTFKTPNSIRRLMGISRKNN